MAPGGGSAAAAPEGGALACPLALAPTSTWWAPVAMWPCQVWHGWGLGGVNIASCDPRDLKLSGFLGTEGLKKCYMYTGVKTFCSASPTILFKA
jgi:hypothetical protein